MAGRQLEREFHGFMKNFQRALLDALRYWKSLAAATLCSVAIAVLWSCNIAAFYPILQVVLDNQSVQQWMDQQLETNQKAARELTLEIEQAERADAGGGDSEAGRQLARNRKQLQTHLGNVDWYLRYRPWADRFLPDDPFQTVAWIVVILLSTTMLKHGFMIANELLVARIAVDITRELRAKLFSKALHIDRSTFSSIGTSGFSAYIVQTAEGLSVGLTNTLGGAVREPLKILACLVGAALINFRLLLLSAVVAPLVGLLLYWISRRLKNLASRTLSQSLSFYDVMIESLNNWQTVQAYTMEGEEEKRFDASTLAMRTFSLKFVLYAALAKPVIEAIGLGMLCTTIVCGAYLVLQGKTAIFGVTLAAEPLSVQGLLTFFGMLIGMTDPLRKVSAVFSSIHTGAISADAIYGLLDHPTHIVDPPQPQTVARPHREVRLHEVSFGYQADRVIVENISLTIPFGATVAIVGANGSGKSTLTNLLCRFFDPLGGSILMDDVSLRDMRIADLRGRVAIVTQQTELFNESVRYNIRYGTPDASDEEVEQAAREAHALDFIEQSLPDGFETRVGQNGHRLSGGQRQRIALARALLRNPEILILDECTSQIDMRSEELIRASLAAHRGRRTMIIITHRESLLALADQIHEVADGTIREISSPLRQAA